jgi:hypothetical protein
MLSAVADASYYSPKLLASVAERMDSLLRSLQEAQNPDAHCRFVASVATACTRIGDETCQSIMEVKSNLDC